MMQEKIHELAEFFVVSITENPPIKNRVSVAVKAIGEKLQVGWTIDSLKKEMIDFKKLYPQAVIKFYHLQELLGNKQPPANLAEADTFYYHNELRILPPPPVITFNEDNQPVRREEAFYLEMKPFYLMDDLMTYWYTAMNIVPTERMKKQDEGKINYLLGNFSLDELLFMIDCAKAKRKDMNQLPLRNMFDLDKYHEDALAFMSRKENESRLNGINRVIKRRESVEYATASLY